MSVSCGRWAPVERVDCNPLPARSARPVVLASAAPEVEAALVAHADVVDAAPPVVDAKLKPIRPLCGDRKCQKNRGENCRTCRADCRCRRNYECPKRGKLNDENRGCVPDLSNLGF